jgi:hypothetical protein
METRRPTHAEAVFIARALNLHIEMVWEILRDVPFSSYAELELTVRTHVNPEHTAHVELDCSVPSI